MLKKYLYIFRAHPRVCLAVMTGSFVPQVLSIKADEITNAVTAGLQCEWRGTGNSLHFPSNVAKCCYETTTSLSCLNGACAMTWNNSRFWTF